MRAMAVTMTQLSAFLAVVRHGSVTAAAEELVVTQPSVSAAVAALERELGRPADRARGPRRSGRLRRARPTRATPADVLALLREGSEVAAEAAAASPPACGSPR